jgi:hypothetical protein
VIDGKTRSFRNSAAVGHSRYQRLPTLCGTDRLFAEFDGSVNFACLQIKFFDAAITWSAACSIIPAKTLAKSSICNCSSTADFKYLVPSASFFFINRLLNCTASHSTGMIANNRRHTMMPMIALLVFIVLRIIKGASVGRTI